EHKLGFPELYDAIAPEIETYEENFGKNSVEDEKSDLQIAITGRPNAGKSTLLNQILEQDRLITGPQAGITRDAIAIDHEFQGKKIRFIDTAGIRKKSNIKEGVEKQTIFDSFRAIRFAQVVILLIDANTIENDQIDHQDLALASEILKEGRGLVFALNKIDNIKGDKEKFMKKIRLQIQNIFSEINGTAIIGISSQNGYNVKKCLEFALKTYEQWTSYIPTTRLIEWLKMAEINHPPRLHKGREIKLKYATQIKKRPPTIAIFVNHIKPLEGSYKRYLSNSFRDFFKLDLTPIRIVFKKSDNPYEGRKDKTFSKRQSGQKRKHK
ncbi:MAG: ribosome biogenesis GTPase Der, partial [Rickettsiales bacterium]|nr:ribosome biogenesis GTPase Der [Rickettsiales bacterium]